MGERIVFEFDRDDPPESFEVPPPPGACGWAVDSRWFKSVKCTLPLGHDGRHVHDGVRYTLGGCRIMFGAAPREEGTNE